MAEEYEPVRMHLRYDTLKCARSQISGHAANPTATYVNVAGFGLTGPVIWKSLQRWPKMLP